MTDRIIFVVQGGIGKVIMSTVPLRGIRKKYPGHQIVVVCGHPDILKNNPNVDRVFVFGSQQYFYDDFILNSNTTVLSTEPYIAHDYVYKKRHLTDVWCEVLGVPFDNSKPDLYLSDFEKTQAQEFIKTLPKPMFILQTHGGPPKAKLYKRDLSVGIAEKVVSALSVKYEVLHLRYNEQPAIRNTKHAFFRLRETLALLPYSRSSLLIDSFAQHAYAAFGKSANVLWGGTSPTCLGYEEHNNIFKDTPCKNQFCHRPNSFLFDMVNNQPWDCSENEACLQFSPEEIL
jgi:hypothetical protein